MLESQNINQSNKKVLTLDGIAIGSAGLNRREIYRHGPETETDQSPRQVETHVAVSDKLTVVDWVLWSSAVW